ncbi:Ribonuclease P protein component [Burkholderiales bacterium]|nr:Ribonuclease P protein component [Burkholderiales bacterium]
MSSRKAVLKKAADFQRVMSQGRRKQGRWLVLSATGGTSEGARLGLVVAKRLAKRAVDRNTIKRILRESFRRVATDLAAVDVVMRLRQPWPEEARADLAVEARRLLGEIK